MAGMSVPDWRTSTAGSRVRVALWLHSEVGRGGTFTKSDLRAAFPNVEQIDRRMRDLRPEGWVIATYREDRSLTPDELRLVEEGGAVWERGYTARPAPGGLSDQQRKAVLADDGFCCVFCGAAAGCAYPDDPIRTAILSATRVEADGDPAMWVAACDRCRAASVRAPMAVEDLLEGLNTLDSAQRERLRSWVAQGSRPRPLEEQLWAAYRVLPAAARQAVRERLEP